MCTVAAGELREALAAALDELERGNWRPVLRIDRWLPPGPGHLVVWGAVLGVVGRSMRDQATGDVEGAWERVGQAAGRLPLGLRLPGPDAGRILARLERPSPRSSADENLVRRIAALIWREQYEIDDLRRRFATLPQGREELVEACIEHVCWTDFNPYTWFRTTPEHEDPPVDRTRSALLSRASRLRQFADPTAGQVSQSVWHDAGQFRGLCAEAFARLADRPAAAPWCGVPGTHGLVVRRGRLWAWRFARAWRADTDHGNRLGQMR